MEEFKQEVLPEVNKYITQDEAVALISTSLNNFTGFLRDQVGRSSLISGSTIGGRNVATVAATINSAGNVITDLINAKLDTSAKTILDAFTFGASGAIQIGTYVNGVTGDIKISPNGIVARGTAGTNTIAIDGITGSVTMTGTITASAGSIGGWTLGATSLSAVSGGNTTILSSGTTAFTAGPTGVPTVTITQAGALIASSATITGALTAAAGSVIATNYLSGVVAQSNLNIANMGWTQTSAFSSTDLDTVSWGAGTLTTTGGTSYSIGVGNTGNMSARTYIYLDIAVSTTAYQTTTTATTAVGTGKILIATAINGAAEATFEVFGGVGGLKVLATDALVANSVTSGLISVSQLSAISADIGAITAGTITGLVITGGTSQTATSGQRIRIISVAGSTPTQSANSFALINSANEILATIGSGTAYIQLIQPMSDVGGLAVASNIASSNSLLSVSQAHASSTAAAVNFSNSGSNNVLQMSNGNPSNTAAVANLTQQSYISTNFRRFFTLSGANAAETIDLWVSDGTTPNGNLTGGIGDICFNGSATGQAFYCTGTTNWTAM